jgi:signal transduction histidine kinase
MKRDDDSARLFVAETPTTRVRPTDRVAPHRHDSELYPRLRGYLARLASLDRAEDVSSLLTMACDAVAELFDVAHLRLCTYDTEHGYTLIAERDTTRMGEPGPRMPMAEKVVAEMSDLLDWAARERKPVFFELTDEDTGRIAEPCDEDDTQDDETQVPHGEPTIRLDAATINLARLKHATALAVLPVVGERGPIGALLAWLREPQILTRVVEADLLEHLCKELSSRAAAMEANTRLRSLSSLFDNILESVPHGIIALGRDGRVIALNGNAEFLFDIKRIFVIDELFDRALPARLGDELRAMMDKLLIQPNVESRLELDLRPGTGMSIGISASFLYDRAGERQGYLFLCRDLSLSLEVQKLRELDRMKTEFVNTVSHELKTPLTAILGGMEIILSENAISEEFRELGDVVQNSALQLRELIFDLLNLARMESGKAQLKIEAVNLRDLVQSRIKLLPPHPRHNVTLEMPQLPPLLLDRDKLAQALTNYLSNAVKYSPEGGDVVCRVCAEGDELSIAVTDQGMGIARENLGRIWEKFYRVDAGFTAEIEGTGLGLVIVQKIVELHGGEVFVESVPGEGSTFGMRLPLQVADATGKG